MSGVPADDPAALVRPDDLVAALARYLHALHQSEPPADAAVADLAAALATATARVGDGLVDPAGFDEPYRRWSPDRLLEVAREQARLAARPPSVPIHGTLRLSALRVDDGEIVPPEEAPVLGDPYADLAYLASDLAAAISPAAVPALFEAYGDERPDPLRIDLWMTLRQLLR